MCSGSFQNNLFLFVYIILSLFAIVGDSGTLRVLVQNRKGFMKELYTGITCIFQRPQRERGILKLYFRLSLYCLSCEVLFEIFQEGYLSQVR